LLGAAALPIVTAVDMYLTSAADRHARRRYSSVWSLACSMSREIVDWTVTPGGKQRADSIMVDT